MATSPPNMQPFSLPPFVAHVFQPTASTSTAAPSSVFDSSKKRQPRRQLPPNAKKMLEDWIEEHAGTEAALRPSPTERRTLLAKIQLLDGADWYTYNHIDRFFINRRKSADNQNGDVKPKNNLKPKSARSENTRSKNWPSLNAEALKRMPDLFMSHSDPDDNMINMWVLALPGAATANDVRKWIQHKKTELCREENSDDEDEDPRVQHLPTPEPTASPEPVYNGLPSPVASLRASPASPIIPQNAPWATTYTRTSAAPTRTYVWQAPVTSVPYIASVPPGAIWRPLPTLAAYAQTKPLQNTAPAAPAAGPSANGSAATAALFKELARSVKDALSTPETEPQDATCVTPAEFVRCFEPHERRFEEFLEKTQRGEYAALGLVPTMIPKDASVIKSEGYDPMDED